MDSLRLDLRFAVRSLFRRRTFSAVAITTIALTIGAGTSIFSVVDAVLFRSLPYRDAGRLVAVWQTIPDWRKEPILAASWDHVVVAYDDFTNWRAKQTSFTAVSAYTSARFLLSMTDQPEQASALRASPSLFEVLGTAPLMGRAFLPGEDIVNGPHVTIASYDAWQTRFGARRDIVGTIVQFDSIPYQIVGVLPKNFVISRGQSPPPFMIPAGQDPNDVGHNNHNYTVLARLKPGVTIDRAATEANQLLGGPDAKPVRGVRILEYRLDQTRDVRTPLLVLLGAVALLVLIACVNVATLLLGEAASREVEMSARLALGATRARLMRQLLTESLVLAGVGGVLGALLAWWMTRGLVALAPPRVPGIQTAHVDGRVLAVTLAAAAITGVLFGLVPALTLSASGPAALLRAGGQSRRGHARLQRLLIATELALSVILLVGAGLLSRSLAKLTAVDPGFRADHLLFVRVALPRAVYRDEDALRTHVAAMLDRFGAVPGVSAITGASPAPFDGGYSSSTIQLESDAALPPGTASKREVQQRVVVPNFFAVMGIPVLVGRAFASDDRMGAPLVAIVSEALARRDWPTEQALGKRIRYQGQMRTIVGIVGDTKVNTLAADNQATIYTPMAQRSNSMTLIVRTKGDPAAAVPAIRAALREVEPGSPVTTADVVEDRIRQSFGEERFRTMLIDLFGIMAAVLAAVGMYGVTARAVGGRMRELGIRLALGATSGSVTRMIVVNTLGGVSAGVLIGIAAAAVASRVIAPYLFGVSPHDPATYAAIVGLLGVVGVVASWVPARRAGRVAPAAVLRGE